MRRAGVLLLATWVLSIGACGPGRGSGTDPVNGSSGGETVALTVDHRSRWRELRIEGTTDLLDGAVVSYTVTHASAAELQQGEWPAKNLIADGTAVVLESQYWARLNTTNWPAGDVRVQIQFPVAPQPPSVRERYGAFGEHLIGDNVTTLGASRVVTAEHTFRWTR